ncbi:hypothetical protein P43SY_010094 [Pythium insidiosum]|uniref:SWIM-type domain-containing protein n=1 Tax=Pythium insidiosum TaxID=114742 RepID=A0AAD5M8M4_PYTIN|nr:hypothetical protein P43SY_010094 [Pythium insidiosum]
MPTADSHDDSFSGKSNDDPDDDIEDDADTFDGWDEFFQHFHEYCRTTHQAIRKKHKLDVDARNEKIRASKAARAGLFVRYVPSIWVVFRRIFICTHGWPQRDRGTGKRPQRFLRSVSCPFKFTVIVRYDEMDRVWRLKVESGHWFHNHVVNPEVFKTYAENRGVEDPSNRVRVENMIENKRKRRPIYDMLLEQGENIVMKDVENMIAAYNKEVKCEDDDAACLGKLAVFAAEDGNWVSIDETAAMETGVINLSSGFMCQTVSRFFEILLFDSSHQTNRFNYQLFTIMAIDDHGRGQAVQHSLLERNADWHMIRVLEHFERVNPGVAEKVEVLMVDKDLNEIKILRKYFPRARVLICSFHVVKYLKAASRKPEYGKVSADDHDAIDAIAHNMVYARTKEEYESNRDMLQDVCAAVGYGAFYAYFEANWDSCIDMWVLYTRLRLPHLRVHTNNHLESFFGHLKGNIQRSFTMTETVDALIKDDRARAHEYLHKKTKIGRFYNANYDADMNQLLRFTNPFVAESVEEEYKLAFAMRDVFVFEEKEGGRVGVRGHTKYHEFDKQHWLCSCSFCSSIKLPCKHVIAYRKMKGAEMSIPLQAVHERWLGPVSTNTTISGSRLKFAPFHDATKMRRWTPAEKYREAVRATEAVCSELATISDDDEFHEHLEFFLDGWRNVRQRKRVKVAVEPDVEPGPSQATQSHGLSQVSQPRSLYSEVLSDVPLVAHELPAAESGLIAHELPAAESGLIADDPASQSRVVHSNVDVNSDSPLEPTTARLSTGEVTLIGLAESLRSEMPALQDLPKRVDGIMTKHLNAVNKRPKYVKMKNPVLNVTAFYILPEKLLEKCFEVLPLGNKLEDAIELSQWSQSQLEPLSREGVGSPTSAGRGNDPQYGHVMDSSTEKKYVECVEIRGVGIFSRAQVEAMGYLFNLKEDTHNGQQLLAWLANHVAPSQFSVRPSDLAADVEVAYPYTHIPGLKGGFSFSCAYRLRDGVWLSDDTIAAVCERATNDFPHARYLGTVQRNAKNGRAAKVDLEGDMKKRVRDAAVDASAKLLIIPVNIGGGHWTVVLVLLDRREIHYYDSMNHTPTMNALKDIVVDAAFEIFSVLKAPFTQVKVNAPLQFDHFNCGIFVLHKILSTLDKTFSNDVSTSGLVNLRYRLLAYVLRGMRD